MLALEAAKANGGTLPPDVLLLPAIVQARNGYVVSRSQARLTADKLFELSVAPGFADTFLRDGEPPAEGSTHDARGAGGDAAAPRPGGP